MTTKEARKGLTVDIYAPGCRVNFCTELTLVGEHVAEIITAIPERPPVEIVPGNLAGTVKAVLTEGAQSPAAEISGNGKPATRPMFGGLYISTSDARFRDEVARVLVADGHPKPAGSYPVALHNRYEATDGGGN